MSEKDRDNDFEFTRETLYDLINKGRDGVQEMIEVAKQSEHPRAYEVLAKLIKDTADTSGQLMDLHRKGIQIDKLINPDPVSLPPPGTTNNLFVGSTTDLQRMLKDINQKEVDKVNIIDGEIDSE